MPKLPAPCCICPAPLGDLLCQDLKTGIAEAYYICPSRITSIAYLPDSNGCDLQAEIASFGLDVTTPTALAEELMQPIYYVKQDDDTGFVHSFEDKFEGGNVIFEHTINFQVNASNPDGAATIRSMVGREVAYLIKTKNGRWLFINHKGGMKVTLNAGNSNQSWKQLTSFGRLTEDVKYVSYSDGGAWADANLVPASLGTGGLINA